MKQGPASAGMLPWLLVGAGAGLLASGVRRRMGRLRFKGLSVLISGGSRGLGLELARQLAAEGAILTLIARDIDELNVARRELTRSGADVEVHACDIREREQVERTVNAILEARGRIDVLINNAGIVQVAPFENLELEDYRESMAVHAWGPLHLISAVVPQMQRRRKGRIVNISSIGGVVAVPHLLAYCMGKFALTGLSDGLRAELAKDGILVTTVAPGLMRTGSHINAFFKGQHRKEFAWFAISGANPLLSTTARRAAGKIIEACRHGDPRLIITLPASLLHFVNALFPGLFAFGSGIAARLLPSPVERPAGNRIYSGWESSSRMAPSILTRLSDLAVQPNNEL